MKDLSARLEPTRPPPSRAKPTTGKRTRAGEYGPPPKGKNPEGEGSGEKSSCEKSESLVKVMDPPENKRHVKRPSSRYTLNPCKNRWKLPEKEPESSLEKFSNVSIISRRSIALQLPAPSHGPAKESAQIPSKKTFQKREPYLTLGRSTRYLGGTLHDNP